MKEGEGEGKEVNLPFFPTSPLFYLRHFSRALTLVSCSLVLNRTETLATHAQAT